MASAAREGSLAFEGGTPQIEPKSPERAGETFLSRKIMRSALMRNRN